MKKITLLLITCCMSAMAFAAGGNITYELNGGVVNDQAWQNKNDMYMGLNQAWNTFSGTETVWKTLDELFATENPVAQGIPTQAGTMSLNFIQDAAVKAEWQWLIDYMDAVCTAQGIADDLLPSANASYLRYNLAAFFVNSRRATWPVSAGYAFAGQAEAFYPTWKHAFAGPASYDGSVAIVIPDPYKEGFTFDGWYENADFSGAKVTTIPAEEEGDKKLYAKWIDYIPNCAEVRALAPGTNTSASGIVIYVNETNAYIQDVTAGLLVEFAEAPDIKVSDKVRVAGTSAALGKYVKITNANLSATESAAALPAQAVALSDLLVGAASYMFEYVYIEGLKIASYNGDNIVLSDDGKRRQNVFCGQGT